MPSSLRYKTHKNNWIKNLSKEGLKPSLCILEETDTDNWEEREKYWIGLYREKLGSKLTNSTTGGIGSAGHIKPAEACKIVSKNTKQFWIGRKHSEESRAKMRQAKLGKKASQETLLKMSKAHSKQYLVKYPDGNEVVINNLTKFCKDNNLNYNSMCGIVHRGFGKHQGFYVEKYKDEDSFN